MATPMSGVLVSDWPALARDKPFFVKVKLVQLQ